MTSGVYRISLKGDRRSYIGISKQIEWRWNQHRGNLRVGEHDNQLLQRAWDKYGENRFEFAVVLECDITLAKRIEHSLLIILWNSTFNLSNSSEYRDYDTGKRSQAERELHSKKMSQAQKDRWARYSDEERQSRIDTFNDRSREWRRTRIISDETRERMSKSHLGKKLSPESIAKRTASYKANRLAKKTSEAGGE